MPSASTRSWATPRGGTYFSTPASSTDGWTYVCRGRPLRSPSGRRDDPILVTYTSAISWKDGAERRGRPYEAIEGRTHRVLRPPIFAPKALAHRLIECPGYMDTPAASGPLDLPDSSAATG